MDMHIIVCEIPPFRIICHIFKYNYALIIYCFQNIFKIIYMLMRNLTKINTIFS